MTTEVKRRVNVARGALRRYGLELYIPQADQSGPLALKVRLLGAEVREAFLYGCEPNMGGATCAPSITDASYDALPSARNNRRAIRCHPELPSRRRDVKVSMRRSAAGGWLLFAPSNEWESRYCPSAYCVANRIADYLVHEKALTS